MAQRTARSRTPAAQEVQKSRGRWNGVTHVRHCDYSPTLGRFIERDPIGFEAGDNNWYRFVANGPTGKTDPSGLDWNSACRDYWYYLTHPWAMDDDLEYGFYGCAAVAGTCASGAGVIGVVGASGAGAASCGSTLGCGVVRLATLVGTKAITSPYLPAGTYPALVINGQVYVARFHVTAWELAGKKGCEQFYGFATINTAGAVVSLFK